MNLTKKLFLLILFGLFSFAVFAYSYRIENISYEIQGMIIISELEKTVPVNKNKTFEDEETFQRYIDSLMQSYTNTRAFESFDLTYTTKEDGLSEYGTSLFKVDLKFTGKTGWHFLAVPYIKYSSSTGLSLKLKAKDTNFFGTMNTFNGSLDLNLLPKVENSGLSDGLVCEPALNLSYDFPFSAGKVDMTWVNDYTLKYTIGNNSPEWDLKTGVTALLPITSIMDFYAETYQGFTRNLDYSEFHDDTYFTETVKLSTPIRVFTLPDSSTIKVTPFTSFRYNWDTNGISEDNFDLLNPTVSMGISSSIGKVDWKRNFKNGYTSNYSISTTYNIKTEKWSEGFSFNAAAYKAFDYAALYSRMNFFIWNNGTEKIGPYLRGVRDNIHYTEETGIQNEYVLNVPSAFVLNIDIPLHMFATDWENFSLTRKMKFMRNFNFELQISPFVDIALVQDPYTKNYFNFAEGFYCGGVEIIVFPAKWTDFQIRASLGFDLGKTLLAEIVNNSRRKSTSSWEVSIGMGLLY